MKEKIIAQIENVKIGPQRHEAIKLHCNRVYAILKGVNGIVTNLDMEQKCPIIIRNFFYELYWGRLDINYEEIQIWGEMASGSKDSLSLRYGNLYSFVLANGVLIPYDEWTYDKEIIIEDKQYTYQSNPQWGTIRLVDKKVKSSYALGA